MESVVVPDPEILSGAPTFRGTRVLVRSLFDYLEAGHSLERFLAGFPSVSRGMALQALEEAKESLLASRQCESCWMGAWMSRFDIISSMMATKRAASPIWRFQQWQVPRRRGERELRCVDHRRPEPSSSAEHRSTWSVDHCVKGRTTDIDDLIPFVPAILAALGALVPGQIVKLGV
jgi:uncharacterized protein (DUF433 family)